MQRTKYIWVTLAPMAWLLICTLTAGFQKIFDANPKIGFLAHADKYQEAIKNGLLVAPATSVKQMQQIIFNDRIDATLALYFTLVVIVLLIFGLISCLRAYKTSKIPAKEIGSLFVNAEVTE